METLKIILEFILDNWLAISAGLWLVIRIIPTQKNYDIAAGLLKLLDRIIANRKKGGGAFKAIIVFAIAAAAMSPGSANAQYYSAKGIEFTGTPSDTATLTKDRLWINKSSDKLRVVLDGTKHTVPSMTDVGRTVPKSLTRNRQTDNYTLALTDNFKFVEINSADPETVTVPPNSSVAFTADATQITVGRYGTGSVTIAAGVGVTIRSADGALGLRAQYSTAMLIKIGTDEWYLIGDIE